MNTAAPGTSRPMTSLWTLSDMAAAMRAEKSGALPAEVPGISIDSRSIGKGEAFFAIQGDNRDGHDFVEAALKAGAGAGGGGARQAQKFSADAPLLAVDDVLEALRDLARAARARRPPRSSPSPARSARPAPRRRCGWRSAPTAKLMPRPPPTTITGACRFLWPDARRALKYAVFEIGMNHAGEITPLTKLVRPHVAIVTAIEPVHLEYFGSLEKIADAKAEIFAGIEPGGAAILNRDNAQYARLAAAAKAAGVARIVTFGEHAKRPTRGCCGIRCRPIARPSRRASLGSR